MSMVNKTLKNILFFAAGIACAILISACVMPVDIDEFLGDEEVQRIIRENRVGLYNRTLPHEGNLTAGNQRIFGLSPYNYYLVKVLREQYDPSGAMTGLMFQHNIPGDVEDILNEGDYDYDGFAEEGFWFVSRSGLLIQEDGVGLAPLGRVNQTDTGRSIRSLFNDLTYIVWNAVPLTGYVLVYDLENISYLSGTAPPTPTPIENGRITLHAPDYYFFMDITSENAITVAGNYTIVRVPVIPDAAASSVSHSAAGNSTVLSLETVQEVDYVFIEYDTYGNVISFRVLSIIMEYAAPPPPPNGYGDLTITLGWAAPGAPLTVVGNITFNTATWQIEGGPAAGQTTMLISIDNAISWNDILWRAFDPVDGVMVPLMDANGVLVGDTGSFTLSFSEDAYHAFMFTLPGIHHINVEARRDGRTYSGTIVITVL